MTLETEFGPGRFAAVTTVAFTLFKRFMLNLAQQSRLIPAMRVMAAQAFHLLRLPVEMSLIECKSGFMTRETESSRLPPQQA
jgi:hypothetical protein